MEINYCKNSDIDLKAWDRCIAGSFNSSICGFSWFLDHICEDWDALIEGDYESVMPLAVRRFLGREVICLPYFAYEFGIFSINPVKPDKTRAFIESIPSCFDYYRIMLNKYNPLDSMDFNTTIQKRFELDLIKPYVKLTGDFSPELQRRLNIAMAHGYYFSAGLSPNDLIRFITEKKIRTSREIYQHDYRLLRTVMIGLIRYKSGELYGLFDQHNELSSVALVAWMNSRINLIFQTTAPDKLRDFPDLFLIDRIIDKYSETNITLFFDSGSTPNLPVPYSDFGARETTYLEIFKNKLPFPYNFLINYRIFSTCLSSSHSSNN